MLYLDMDGVLVDLVYALHRTRTRRPLELRPSGYSLTDVLGWEPDLTRFRAPWWAGLPRTQFASQLVECILDYWDDSGICILTHAVTPAAAAGKIVWMKANFPRISHQIMIVTGPKSVVRPTYSDILIDDCDANIRAWEPGYGITVPQTWNSLHAHDVLPHIEAAMKGYFHERFRS